MSTAPAPVKFTLQRRKSSDEGTPGDFYSENGVFRAVSGELDWVDEDKNGKRDSGMSRAKAGIYLALWGESPSRKNQDGSAEWTYRFQDVPDIAGMLIHSGNFCGRIDRGNVSDVEGCVILGADWTDIGVSPKKIEKANERNAERGWSLVTRTSQKGVSASKPTMAAFLAFTKKQPILVDIRDWVGAA